MIIESKTRNYELVFTKSILHNRNLFEEKIKGTYDNLYFFIDKQVYELYKTEIDEFTNGSKMLLIEAKEDNKDYINLSKYYQWLIENHFTRKDYLVTIGGGILQDISGFIASTMYRGLKWVLIPTTLLAQADSCIGSKTSINFGSAKNLIGTYYPPDYIFNDNSFCDTLTDSFFNSGVGEIIKFHLLSDNNGYAKLLNYLNSENLRTSGEFESIIRSTLEIKYSYFSSDEYDTGRRNLLNYGHCFGHALESATMFEVSHGEAVIVGMGFANTLSLQRGILDKKLYEELERIFCRFYPDFDLSAINAQTIIKYLKKDKKRVGNNLTMILLTNIGESFKSDDVTVEEIEKTFEVFFSTYRAMDK